VSCVFCDRIAEGDYVERSNDGIAPSVIFEPLNPVTPGHYLVVPVLHVTDALEFPRVTGAVMEYAVLMAQRIGFESCNLITSTGSAATQTVMHLHIHIVPRREGDGLHLPWTGQP